MESVPSQLIEKFTAHAQSDNLEDAREICANGTYFPNNLRIQYEPNKYTFHKRIFQFLSFWCLRHISSVPGSSVGIATELRAGRSGDRIPVAPRFSAPVQTGPETHPSSYRMGTGSFPGVKRPGRGFDHPPPSNVVKERGGYTSAPSLGLDGLF